MVPRPYERLPFSSPFRCLSKAEVQNHNGRNPCEVQNHGKGSNRERGAAGGDLVALGVLGAE